MTIEEWEQWQEAFAAFHARFADLFERSESREQAKKYLRGLLAQAERKNSWQVAEAVGERIPDRMQRLLYRVPWDADAARDRLQQFVIESFGDEEGIGVVDETSFRKKGTHSVGVARQYLGTAGKLENGQVATVLSGSSQRSPRVSRSAVVSAARVDLGQRATNTSAGPATGALCHQT